MFRSLRQAVLTGLLLLAVAGAAEAGVKLASEMTIERVAQPGERYRGALTLQNNAAAPAEAKVYQPDYSFAADGSNDYGEPGQLERSNAKWISLSTELVRIPAGGTEELTFEVHVPRDKGLSGTYWSMIMVEPIAALSREAIGEQPDNSARIAAVMRYGVQVVTQIGQSGATGLVFTNSGLIDEDGQRVFRIDAENTGSRWLRPSLWLELYREDGTPVGKSQGPTKRLYPGTSAQFHSTRMANAS
ncbi:hypothetical protein Thimo_1091 [Thioflavicoccus mobilis 8321]|uniref:P pilus assembly protein, chaperone PapD n=1 Tax=Thioflavicoccus mobilis 8321 TaxID=765912 RepID=L0GWZ6_9GAMM|nr:hypothetical protein [Thioflavicoccus mobilis]AGA89895.1 hypothetical protein Thimo_1091 [Thioflavicoccus mobilis 8321]